MIGSPITHLSLESHLCQGTCMTCIPGPPTRGSRSSREQDIPGHLQVVLRPLEKAVVPMGAILLDVKIQVLIPALTAHAANRRLTTAEDMPMENQPWTMQPRASSMEQRLQLGIEGAQLK